MTKASGGTGALWPQERQTHQPCRVQVQQCELSPVGVCILDHPHARVADDPAAVQVRYDAAAERLTTARWFERAGSQAKPV